MRSGASSDGMDGEGAQQNPNCGAIQRKAAPGLSTGVATESSRQGIPRRVRRPCGWGQQRSLAGSAGGFGGTTLSMMVVSYGFGTLLSDNRMGSDRQP